MKKALSFICALVLLLGMASQAYAASYLKLSRVKRLLKEESSNSVKQDTLDSGTEFLFTAVGEGFAVFNIVGNNDNILSFLFFLEQEPYTDELAALKACNEWNDERRYPRVYLDLEKKKFVVDNFLMCTSDVTDDMISEFLGNQLFGAEQLISFLQEKGFDVK